MSPLWWLDDTSTARTTLQHRATARRGPMAPHYENYCLYASTTCMARLLASRSLRQTRDRYQPNHLLQRISATARLLNLEASDHQSIRSAILCLAAVLLAGCASTAPSVQQAARHYRGVIFDADKCVRLVMWLWWRLTSLLPSSCLARLRSGKHGVTPMGLSTLRCPLRVSSPTLLTPKPTCQRLPTTLPRKKSLLRYGGVLEHISDRHDKIVLIKKIYYDY